MKVTAILLFRKLDEAEQQPVLLASAMDLSHFAFYERRPAKDFLLFACRTIATKTENGVRQSVKEANYVISAVNRNGLCGLICTDDAYPRQSAYACVRKALDEYEAFSGGRWRGIAADNKEKVPCVESVLKEGQDPANVDKLVEVQGKIEETRQAAEKTMRDLLGRGEKIEDLAAMSNDLGMEAQMLMKNSKQLNKCCTIL